MKETFLEKGYNRARNTYPMIMIEKSIKNHLKQTFISQNIKKYEMGLIKYLTQQFRQKNPFVLAKKVFVLSLKECTNNLENIFLTIKTHSESYKHEQIVQLHHIICFGTKEKLWL